MEQLYVGVGRADITPPMGTRMQGYSPPPVCVTVHDPVHITVFAFACGQNRAILASADMCNMRGQINEQARKALSKGSGVPYEHCIVACTHTHSGPHSGWPEDEPFVFIRDVFSPMAEKAAAAAVADLRPAVMGIGTTQSQIAVNRRQIKEDGAVTLGQNPYGPYDPTMTVVSFREPDGTPIGSLIHYGCHNTAAGRTAEISRDWCGVAKDRLEEITGGVAGFFNGCGGDCGPRLPNGKTTGDLAMAMAFGEKAAADVCRAYENITQWISTDMRVLSAEICLPLQKAGTVEQIMAEAAALGDPKKLKADGSTVYTSYRRLMERAEYIREGNVPPAEQAIPHVALALGPLVLLTVPFEPFSIITLRIKEFSPFRHTLCVGYANGALSYFPSMDQMIRGGYEVRMFRTINLIPFTEDAENHYVKGSLKLLRRLYEQA